MKTSWRFEMLQLLLIAAMFIVAAWCWPRVPDRIPVHWNLHGDADRMGGKFEALFGPPLLALMIYVLLRFIPRIDPGRENYASFATAYNKMRLAALVFIAVFDGIMVSVAMGRRPNVGSFVLLPMGLLFMVLGNYMGKLRPNWFAGIRTPWTLSSKLSWDKTHQQAGWILFAIGAGYVIAGFVPVLWVIVAAVAFSILCLSWLVVYSYLVFRSDPHRVSPSGTSPEIK